MHLHIDNETIAKALIGTCAPDSAPPIPKPFTIGSRVKIIEGPCTMNNTYSYHGRYVGCYGEVVKMPELSCSACADRTTITIGVLLDGKHNERSQYGCYWFKPEELYVITEEEKENNKMLLLKGYKIARVGVNGHGIQYVAHYEEALEEGDLVVVAAEEGYDCGTVLHVYDEVRTNDVPKFQVVCKIDDSAYVNRHRRAEEAAKLEKKLEEAVRDYQKIALFEMMAEKNPTIAALLAQYKEVTNA